MIYDYDIIFRRMAHLARDAVCSVCISSVSEPCKNGCVPTSVGSRDLVLDGAQIMGRSSPSCWKGPSILFRVRGEGARVGSLERGSQPPPNQLEGWGSDVSCFPTESGWSPGR